MYDKHDTYPTDNFEKNLDWISDNNVGANEDVSEKSNDGGINTKEIPEHGK